MEKQTREEMVQEAIEEYDLTSIELHGGYPSEYVIENDKVYRAWMDHDGIPRLTAKKVDDFLKEYKEYLDDTYGPE